MNADRACTYSRSGIYRPCRTLLCAAALSVILSGCAGNMLKDMLFPTPVACAPKDSPVTPKILSNSILSKMDDYHFTLIIAAERLELIDYAGKADAIIQACK